MKKLWTIVVASLLLGACAKESEGWYTDGETMYLETDGAVLPVWVTGNIESGTFVICNHGGPGTVTGYEFHKNTSFRNLEEKYAFVYYDQRMSGNSKGDPKLGDLTIQQHVLDLEKLVALIDQEYAPKQKFMLGHSWGGGLSILYMGKDNNQNDFNGWIDIDGSLQDKWEMDLKRDWQLPRAQAQYDATGDQHYLDIIQWWGDNPYPDEGDWEPYNFASDLGAYVYDQEAAEAANPYSNSQYYFFSASSAQWYSDDYYWTNWMAGYDFMESAKRITIPTLLVWGKEDGAVPYQVADSVYNLVQTPQSDKYNLQYEEAAHSPHWEKPDQFYNDVTTFIEKYK